MHETQACYAANPIKDIILHSVSLTEALYQKHNKLVTALADVNEKKTKKLGSALGLPTSFKR